MAVRRRDVRRSATPGRRRTRPGRPGRAAPLGRPAGAGREGGRAARRRARTRRCRRRRRAGTTSPARTTSRRPSPPCSCSSRSSTWSSTRWAVRYHGASELDRLRTGAGRRHRVLGGALRGRPAAAATSAMRSGNGMIVAVMGTSVTRRVSRPVDQARCQSQARRVAGMSARPSPSGTTPSTWWMLVAWYSNAERRAGHVEPPDPRPRLADQLDGPVPGRLEVGHPRPQRQRVVLPQRLDVTDLEPGPLHRADAVADVDELAVGEHVAADERARARPASRRREEMAWLSSRPRGRSAAWSWP